MNYYCHHLNDYMAATAHLSWDEDAAYKRLMEVYYMREMPLPLDEDQLFRLARATTEIQRNAVMVVIGEFFTRKDDGFHQHRCDEEIFSFQMRSKMARRAGKASAKTRTKRKASNGTPTDPQQHTPESVQPPTTHYPLPINQEPLPKRSAADSGLEAALREAAGWQTDPSPNLFVTGPIETLIASGADLELDVLPTIRAKASRLTKPNWRYFVEPIREAVAARLDAAKPIATNGARHAATSRRETREDRFAVLGEAVELARQRER